MNPVRKNLRSFITLGLTFPTQDKFIVPELLKILGYYFLLLGFWYFWWYIHMSHPK